MPTPWLLFHSVLLITLISRNNAASTSNPKNDTSPELLSNNTSASDRTFQILPSSASPNSYWPLEYAAPITGPTLAVNTSQTPRLTAPQISCNGRLYGRNFNIASCLQVYHAMSNLDLPRTFGERSTGQWDAPLPFRYLSHDGLCAVDLSHAADITFDTISPLELRETVRVLIQICVSGKPSEGGLATGLGVNKGLALRIVRYKPSVTCGPDGTGPPWITCRYIIDAMPANNKRQYFAPKRWGNGTVGLPWSHTTAQKRCAMTVDTTEPGTDDLGDWYKIWAAANAVDYMCCQMGKRGTAFGLGDQKRLQVVLKEFNDRALSIATS